jgi:hypothetical protein
MLRIMKSLMNRNDIKFFFKFKIQAPDYEIMGAFFAQFYF